MKRAHLSVGIAILARLGALVMAASEVGCQSLEDGAKSNFSKSYTCPMDRVEVRLRPELHPSDWFQARKPTNEVASDPERLRMWLTDQDRLRTYGDKYHSIYEARGCGHESLYECGRAGRGSTTGVMCRERNYLPGAAKW